MTPRPLWSALALCVAWILLVPSAHAQEFGRMQELETNVPYFYYARPGQATVQVSVWGGGGSGIYEIPDSTDLDKLLTMTGGAGIGERESAEKRPRVTVRLYRPSEPGDGPIFEARLESMLAGGIDYPTLEDDDIVLIETIQPSRFTWRDGLSLTSTGLSMALLILRIVEISN